MQIIEIPGFLRSQTLLLEEADIHWGLKEGGKKRSVGGRDRGGGRKEKRNQDIV